MSPPQSFCPWAGPLSGSLFNFIDKLRIICATHLFQVLKERKVSLNIQLQRCLEIIWLKWEHWVSGGSEMTSPDHMAMHWQNYNMALGHTKKFFLSVVSWSHQHPHAKSLFSWGPRSCMNSFRPLEDDSVNRGCYVTLLRAKRVATCREETKKATQGSELRAVL